MSKRKFRIDGDRYGGEWTVGTVSSKFVDYWAPIIEEKGQEPLIEHIIGLDWEDSNDIDPNSPHLFDDEEMHSNWYDIDDIDHGNGMYADGNFTVTEVTDAGDDWAYNESEQRFEANCLLGRELYSNATSVDESDAEEWLPVLFFHSSEKGGFGSWVVETDGEDFDASKVLFSQVETEIGEFVDGLYYKGKQLECDYDYCDTVGKAYYATVGYAKKEWLDTWDKYDDETMKEYWAEMEEHV